MVELRGSRTHQHLLEAFAREAQATVMFDYYARIAEIEGYPDAADALRELAASERLYAEGHLDYLRLVGDPATGLPVGATDRNLLAVLTGNTADERESYPTMARTAHAEGFPEIASWFETLSHSKRHHAGRVRGLLDDHDVGSDAKGRS